MSFFFAGLVCERKVFTGIRQQNSIRKQERSKDEAYYKSVTIENDKYVTKGDANESVDPEKITFDRIQGKIQKLNIPFIGYYINFIQHHMYFLIIVMVILVLEFLLSNIKNKKEVTNE